MKGRAQMRSSQDYRKLRIPPPVYRARARPRTPAAPARLSATPVGAAALSSVVGEAEPEGDPEAGPEAEPEAEDDAASESVAEAEEEEEVVVTTVVVPVVVGPELEPVTLDKEELILPAELVSSAEIDDANEG